jgi:hypothetical protein
VNRLASLGFALGGAAAGALAVYLLVPGGGAAPASSETEEAPAGSLGTIQLDPQVIEQAGIELTPLAAANRRGASQGYARALDLSPLASIASDIVTAQAAVDASQAELKRLETLSAADQAASQREVEAARAQATADKAKLALACQRITLEYGAGLSRLGCGAMAGLVRDAASGNAALLRIDMPGGTPAPGASVTIGEGASAAQVRVLGPAATGDTQLQTAGALALLRGRAAREAQVGRVLNASAPSGASRSGVMVPRDAIVRADSGLFVYRSLGKGGFERVSLDGAEASDAGWFVPTGALKPGDSIVTSGAGTLLGLEHSAPSAGDD